MISLVLLGKYLEQKAKKRTLAALEQLASLQPAQARVWQASRGQWQLQSASAVQSGDRLQVVARRAAAGGWGGLVGPVHWWMRR